MPPSEARVTAGGLPVAVAGEALVDLVLEPDGRVTPHLGGGSFNTARALGRLGLQPLFIGRVSRDRYGRELRCALRDSGVRLDGIVTTDDPTTFARVEVDASGAANYRFYVDGTSSPGLLRGEASQAMPRGAAVLHLGGLGLVFEPQASAIAALVGEADPATLILVDPNCRPEAVRDPKLYRERLHQVLRRADVVKASEEDLVYLEPERTPWQTARGLLELGPSVVLLTQGSRGATVVTVGGEASIEAAKARVVDTIGAGDAFGAAWLAAWLHEGLGRADLHELDSAARCADFAAAVAARTCERAGAESPSFAELGLDWCLA